MIPLVLDLLERVTKLEERVAEYEAVIADIRGHLNALTASVIRLEDRLQSVLDVNQMWDGS